MKVVLDVGHKYKTTNPKDRGVVVEYKGIIYKESELAEAYIKRAKALLVKEGIEVITNDPVNKILIGDYEDRHRFVNEVIKPDIYIQCHFNSSPNGNGNYVLVSHDFRAYDRTIAYAYILAIKTSQKLGLPYQVWEMNYKTRGFSCIKQVIAPALLYEPCFVNNPKHLEKLVDGNWLDLIAEAIYETIMEIKRGIQIPTEIASIFRKDTPEVRKFFENKYA
jgi:N-acetylmuramoyl-L-alanine amidase